MAARDGSKPVATCCHARHHELLRCSALERSLPLLPCPANQQGVNNEPRFRQLLAALWGCAHQLCPAAPPCPALPTDRS